MALRILRYLKKRKTKLGLFIWIVNGALSIFFVEFTLQVVLDSYGFLSDFMTAAMHIGFYLFVSISAIVTKFRLNSYLDSLPLIVHLGILIFLTLLNILPLRWNQKVQPRHIKP